MANGGMKAVKFGRGELVTPFIYLMISPDSSKLNGSAAASWRGKPMKIYMNEFNEYLGGLTHDDLAVRQKAVRGLAKYSGAQWQGTPDATAGAGPAPMNAAPPRRPPPPDGAVRAAAPQRMGNI